MEKSCRNCNESRCNEVKFWTAEKHYACWELKEEKQANEIINELIQTELEGANSLYPAFIDSHQAYAVLLEELEESQYEMIKIKTYVGNIWEYVKDNDEQHQRLFLDYLENATKRAITELIQVAAMCNKFKQLFEKQESDKQIKKNKESDDKMRDLVR